MPFPTADYKPMRDGLRDLKAECTPAHPVQLIEKQVRLPCQGSLVPYKSYARLVGEADGFVVSVTATKRTSSPIIIHRKVDRMVAMSGSRRDR